jgi:hypothetical protein
MVRGVTDAVIRKAVGLWAREALARWHERHPDPRHLLIGEIPLIGHRLVELARPAADAVEPLLGAAFSRFVIPVPSREVRSFLEAERRQRMVQPRHAREREDAPPDVLHTLWRELALIGVRLGLATTIPEGEVPYDPDLYRSVYEHVLAHRHPVVLHVTMLLPTRELSVYDFAAPKIDLLPAAEEAAAFIQEIERQYPDPEALADEVERWYFS